MALIKNVTSDRILKSAVVLDMGDLGRQAERILGAARDEAKKILNEASAEARRMTDIAAGTGHAEGLERGLKEGRTAGRIEGREQSLSESREQLAQLTQSWNEAMTAWERARAAMFADAKEDVLRFAFSLGEKVVHRLVRSDPSIVRDQLAQALRLLSRPSAIEILINPSDRALVEEVLPELAATVARCEHISIRDDAAITAGGCMVVTAGGRVDATIDTQLARIAEALVPHKSGADSTGTDAPPSDRDGASAEPS